MNACADRPLPEVGRVFDPPSNTSLAEGQVKDLPYPGPGARTFWRAAEDWLVAAALGAMVALPLIELALRSLFRTGLAGSSTLVQHLSLFISLAGGALAARDGRLLAFSTLPTLLTGRWATAARWFSHTIAATVAAALALASVHYVGVERAAGQPFLGGVPLWVIELVLPLGFAAIALRLVGHAADTWRSKILSGVGVAGLIASGVWSPLAAATLAWPAAALLSAFFTALTGASGVTILALAGLLMPVLRAAKFSERDALGMMTGAGSLGILLRPCLPVIFSAPRGASGRLLAAVFCLGLAGCVSAPPASLRPAVPLVAQPDFNGTFAWVNWATSLRSHTPGEIGGGNHRPLLPWHRLANSSTVLVTHRPDLLALTYRTKSGQLETRFFDPAAPPAAWRDGELRYDWGTAASGLGLARSSTAVAQLQDGRIVFSSTATDAGMWLVPVYARGEDVITLERAANPADATELRSEFAAALARRAAALAGDPAAALALSSAFSSPVAPGIGWERHFAIELLRPAARAGAVDIQLRLAEFLSNTAEGFAIYRRAAATGNLAAQYHVAGAYQHGQGVAKNPPEAVRWYRMAAEAGHPMSQHMLASALEKGEGVPPDLVEAYIWQRRWAEHAFTNPRATTAKEVARTAVDRIGAKLTSARRAEVEARALDWKPSPPRRPPVD